MPAVTQGCTAGSPGAQRTSAPEPADSSFGLPRYEERFLQLLREQSDQILTLLSHRLDQERSAIKTRLELVNESLLSAEFNPGTHLVIDPVDKLGEEVRAFKRSLREALSHSFRADDPELDERRFVVLSELVRRFASQETADKSWKSLSRSSRSSAAPASCTSRTAKLRDPHHRLRRGQPPARSSGQHRAWPGSCSRLKLLSPEAALA
jgi:hypothetical protein